MNWQKLKYFFVDAAIWLVAHWWILVVLGAILLVVLIAGYVDSCRTANYEEKKERLETNIQTGKIESNIQQNQINAAANNSNRALENVNAAKGQNINSVSNDYDDARRRYCERFPEDCK